MSHRESLEALSQRHDALARELAASREHTKGADAQRAFEMRVEAEMLEIAAKLGIMRDRRGRLPLLENIAIASPCTADWAKMKGDDRVRFCGDCKKDVYNLSAMSGPEAEALLAEREGNMCVRLYKRADGTVLSADCEVGVKRKRRRRIAASVVSAGAMAFAGASITSAGVSAKMMGAPPTVAYAQPPQHGVVEPSPAIPIGEQQELMGDVGPIMMAPPLPRPPVQEQGYTMGGLHATPPKPKAQAPEPPHPVMGHVTMGRRAMTK